LNAQSVLDIKIQAASVNTGSGMKDAKLKGKDFFNVQQDPLITFHSTKVVEINGDMTEFDGDFTIRGVTKPEKLTFTVTGKGTGSGEIKGTMAFDRKDYGMNKGIPFVTIADRVEVIVDLKGKRVSGPPGPGKGGTGVLSVDGKEVVRKTMPHTVPAIMTMDETFDVGVDTRTPVDFTYEVPFRFTGTIDKLTFKLGPRQWSEGDRRTVEEMLARAHD